MPPVGFAEFELFPIPLVRIYTLMPPVPPSGRTEKRYSYPRARFISGIPLSHHPFRLSHSLYTRFRAFLVGKTIILLCYLHFDNGEYGVNTWSWTTRTLRESGSRWPTEGRVVRCVVLRDAIRQSCRECAVTAWLGSNGDSSRTRGDAGAGANRFLVTEQRMVQ